MKKLFLSLALIISFIILSFYGCSNADSNSKDIGKILYNSGCNKCHDNSIICLNIGKDNAYWKKTVNRMAKKVKDRKVDETLLIQNLLSLKKGKNEICN